MTSYNGFYLLQWDLRLWKAETAIGDLQSEINKWYKLSTSAAKDITEHLMLRALQLATVWLMSLGSHVVRLPIITSIYE